MPLRKSKYKNMDKYRSTILKQKERYRWKNGAYKWRTPWNEIDDQAVMDHSIPDSELSKQIKHSVASIHARRSKLKSERH